MRALSFLVVFLLSFSIQARQLGQGWVVEKKDGHRVLSQNSAQLFSSTSKVEKNFLIHLLEDPDFHRQWSLSNRGESGNLGQVGLVGSDINVFPLWSQGYYGSEEMIVAVIDTGADWNHPDLKGNLYTNPNEIPNNGIDDDHNGYIDDVHGWNFVENNPNSQDDNGHGTHCAGVIGARGDNGIGIAGINWKVKILPIKIMDAKGSGDLKTALDGIDYAVRMGARVLSNSWGGDPYSDLMKEAIERTEKANRLFVAAAGNDGTNNDEDPLYPASYSVSNVISVAATDNRDQLANFSNIGPKTVHLAAPGVWIYSTVQNGNYDTFSGTSMATPHVAGGAALLWTALPNLSALELKDRLLKSVDPVYELKRTTISKGRMNLGRAFLNERSPLMDPPEEAWISQSYHVETPHPYNDAEVYVYEISSPGAKMIRLHFDWIDVNKFDQVLIFDQSDRLVETISEPKKNYFSEPIRGEKVRVVLKADYSMVGEGFKIDRLDTIK
ncbi:MAG: hypothetical protein BroJett040_02140 [Oligoflexia bacterium]|nr:MAG: hypothetical protein BroJett040_02140 [Oligoflexia bacterium]